MTYDLHFDDALTTGGSTGLIVVFIKITIDYVQKNKMLRHREALKDQVLIYELLNRLLLLTEASRASIYSSSDSGGVPTPSKPVYLTRLYWSYAKTISRPEQPPYRQGPDEAMCKILKDLSESGYSRVITSELPDNSYSKAYMSSLGFAKTRFYRILMNDKSLIFLVLSFGTENKMSDASVVSVEETLSSLERVFKKYEGDLS